MIDVRYSVASWPDPDLRRCPFSRVSHECPAKTELMPPDGLAEFTDGRLDARYLIAGSTKTNSLGTAGAPRAYLGQQVAEEARTRRTGANIRGSFDSLAWNRNRGGTLLGKRYGIQARSHGAADYECCGGTKGEPLVTGIVKCVSFLPPNLWIPGPSTCMERGAKNNDC
jgi:hypothetical protein